MLTATGKRARKAAAEAHEESSEPKRRKKNKKKNKKKKEAAAAAAASAAGGEEEEEDAEFVVDGQRRGNVGRFFNHSSEPNLFMQCVFTGVCAGHAGGCPLLRDCKTFCFIQKLFHICPPARPWWVALQSRMLRGRWACRCR